MLSPSERPGWPGRGAVALAVIVGSLQSWSFAVAESRLDISLTADTSDAALIALRWVTAAGWILPWFLAAGVLARANDRRRSGAMLATIGAVTAAATLGSIDAAVSGAAVDTARVVAVAIPVVSLLVVPLAIVAARRGPRPARGHAGVGLLGTGWYVAAAVLAWLPSVFASSAHAPPGASRHFVEFTASAQGALDVTAVVVPGLVAAGLLWLAPRLDSDVGGVVAVTYAAPQLLAELPAAVTVVRTPDMIFTPTGVLGPAGLLCVLVLGVVDWRRARSPAGNPPAGP